MNEKQNNSRWKCLKPEDMTPDTDYSITLNPQLQYFDDADRINKIYVETFKMLCAWSAWSGTLQMEVSSNGRLHWHGVIRIKDIKKFYVDIVPCLQARYSYEIDTIQDMETWMKYCTKQKHILDHKLVIQYVSPLIVKPIPKYFRQSKPQEEEDI